ncbi:MAG TPA: hypothetical protein DD621_03135 [Clostridiales bacterium]|nr:hypothetical protein [Clostridiales bacterium]
MGRLSYNYVLESNILMEENTKDDQLEKVDESQLNNVDEDIQLDEEDDDKLSFKLDNFEGPLDLLIHLIKKNKMEIEEIEISKITEQYLELMSNLEELDLEKASDFIEMAAYLIELKSKIILPRLLESENEEDEEDPTWLLTQRLKEYELFKETSEKLKVIEDVNKFYKEPEEDANKFRIVLKDMSLDLLLNAFTGLLTRATKSEKENEPKQIAKEKFTVTQKIASIKDALLLQPKIMFSELFEQSISREEVITTFMALLELLKLQEIKCKQAGAFCDIEITKAENENTDNDKPQIDDDKEIDDGQSR